MSIQYYKSKNSCFYYYLDECEEDLEHWLQGDKLTDRQVNILENECDCYIESGQKYLYFLGQGIELTLPKKALYDAYRQWNS